jgi:hypothetical protein
MSTCSNILKMRFKYFSLASRAEGLSGAEVDISSEGVEAEVEEEGEVVEVVSCIRGIERSDLKR